MENEEDKIHQEEKENEEQPQKIQENGYEIIFTENIKHGQMTDSYVEDDDPIQHKDARGYNSQ